MRNKSTQKQKEKQQQQQHDNNNTTTTQHHRNNNKTATTRQQQHINNTTTTQHHRNNKATTTQQQRNNNVSRINSTRRELSRLEFHVLLSIFNNRELKVSRLPKNAATIHILLPLEFVVTSLSKRNPCLGLDQPSQSNLMRHIRHKVAALWSSFCL